MSVLVNTVVHGTIARARTSPGATDWLNLELGEFYGPTISFHVKDEELVARLIAAINSTIEAHAADLAQRTSIQEAAE